MVILRLQEQLHRVVNMSKSFSINEVNDIYLDTNGNLAISTGLTALIEICKQYMQTILGELVLNTTTGLPYFQSVFTGVSNIQQYVAAGRAALLTVEGVTQVISFDVSMNEKVLSYVATIQTIYGTGVVNG
jgi:hypothetical protein